MGVRVKGFREHLLISRRSALTVRKYCYWVRRAELFGLDLRKCGPEELTCWLNTLPGSAETLKGIRSSLKAYWLFIGRKRAPDWAIIVPRQGEGLCLALEPEAAAILAQTARQDGGRKGLAVLLGLYSALRRFEIAKVKRADFSRPGWQRVDGKGNRSDLIPLHPEIEKALKSYPPEPHWLFPAPRGTGHVVPFTIWLWTKDLALRAGLSDVTVHKLRHTALATANDESHDLRTVQALARHSGPNVTARYTRAKPKRMVEVSKMIKYEVAAGALAQRADPEQLCFDLKQPLSDSIEHRYP